MATLVSLPAGTSRARGVVPLAIGLTCLGGLLLWFAHRQTLTHTAVAASARLVANAEREWTDNSKGVSTIHHSYCAVVEYADPRGTTWRHQDSVCYNPPMFQVGEVVQVRYDPETPSHAWIDHGDRGSRLPAVIALVGVVLVFGGSRRLRRGPQWTTDVLQRGPSSRFEMLADRTWWRARTAEVLIAAAAIWFLTVLAACAGIGAESGAESGAIGRALSPPQ